jgi:hypothetical protein
LGSLFYWQLPRWQHATPLTLHHRRRSFARSGVSSIAFW